MTGGKKRRKMNPLLRMEWVCMKKQTISKNSAFAFTYYYFISYKGIE